MSVAAPHIFENIIIGTTSVIGFILNTFAIDIATGVIRNIVVTLSRTAETIAVINIKRKNTAIRFPLESLKSLAASHSNTLVWAITHTTIIIANRRAITSQSILANAWSRVRNCNHGTKVPNTCVKKTREIATKNTTNVLCTFSVATSTITKNITSDINIEPGILSAASQKLDTTSVAGELAKVVETDVNATNRDGPRSLLSILIKLNNELKTGPLYSRWKESQTDF